MSARVDRQAIVVNLIALMAQIRATGTRRVGDDE